MATVGIVAEYNPFHNGHAYHLKESKQTASAEHILCVMSGDFTQRGEPSIIDKYKRTEMALLNGVDIVIELPVMFATSSASYFAFAAIYLLHSTGIVDSVCFGSENTDIGKISLAADYLLNESTAYKTSLQKNLKEGVSFASARSKAFPLNQFIPTEPNCILALEYIKALKRLNSKISPLAILRINSRYNSQVIEGSISSAASIRKSILSDDWESACIAMPDICTNILKNSNLSKIDDYSLLLHNALINKSVLDISKILDVTEGLENRILRKSLECFYISDILSSIKTKRYAYSTLQRAILHIILNITKSAFAEYNGYPPYIRVLGFRKDKEFLLRQLINNASLPVIINLKDYDKIEKSHPLAYKMISFDVLASSIYNATAKNPKNEFSRSVIRV